MYIYITYPWADFHGSISPQQLEMCPVPKKVGDLKTFRRREAFPKTYRSVFGTLLVVEQSGMEKTPQGCAAYTVYGTSIYFGMVNKTRLWYPSAPRACYTLLYTRSESSWRRRDWGGGVRGAFIGQGERHMSPHVTTHSPRPP